jgi:hypothetical protein
MAGKTTAFSNFVTSLILGNVTTGGASAFTTLVGTAGSATTLYLSLHTADPGVAGNQSTSEISYTGSPGYTRQAITRASAWTLGSGNTATLAAAYSFGTMTGGTGGTVQFFGIGLSSSGAGTLLYTGPVTPNIVVSNGVNPQLTALTSVQEA